MLKPFEIIHEGKELKVFAEVVDRKIWFKVQDEIMSLDIVELQESVARKSQGAKKSADRITSPMPGKITKVFKTKNDIVEKGEALLVMEAMKMEYTLKSDLHAIVENVGVQVGDQVTLGQLLVQLSLKKTDGATNG